LKIRTNSFFNFTAKSSNLHNTAATVDNKISAVDYTEAIVVWEQ